MVRLKGSEQRTRLSKKIQCICLRNSLSRTHNPHRGASIARDSGVPDTIIIKPTALLDQDSVECYPYDVFWYDCWVRHQMESQPRDLYSVLRDTEAKQEDIPMMELTTVWKEVWVQTSKGNTSIDSVVTCLFDKTLFKMHNTNEALNCAKNLVFAIIGWQTMLYKPDTGSCPRAQLAIVDETNGYRGYAYMNLRQDEGASKRPLYEFFMGFGVLLPGYNFGTLVSDDDKRALVMTRFVTPDSLNAHLLTTIGGIQLKWTDSLACHLELDTDSGMLYLFRFPTFSAVSLLGLEKHQTKPTLHSCAAPTTSAYSATHEDISDFLRETLLSYRLLFGQNKASRRLFRSLKPFDDLPKGCKDRSLSDLCGKKQSHFETQLPERESYLLDKDFPILKCRLAVLAHHFANRRPRTWKELWKDKRDSASWFTFWAVLIVGGVAIILSFVQVVLQIVQVGLQIKQH